MTIPYVSLFLWFGLTLYVSYWKNNSFNITQKRKILLIIQRWILVFRSTLILWCRISSRCLHLGMERQLIVPPGLLGLLLLVRTMVFLTDFSLLLLFCLTLWRGLLDKIVFCCVFCQWSLVTTSYEEWLWVTIIFCAVSDNQWSCVIIRYHRYFCFLP